MSSDAAKTPWAEILLGTPHTLDLLHFSFLGRASELPNLVPRAMPWATIGRAFGAPEQGEIWGVSWLRLISYRAGLEAVINFQGGPLDRL